MNSTMEARIRAVVREQNPKKKPPPGVAAIGKLLSLVGFYMLMVKNPTYERLVRAFVKRKMKPPTQGKLRNVMLESGLIDSQTAVLLDAGQEHFKGDIQESVMMIWNRRRVVEAESHGVVFGTSKDSGTRHAHAMETARMMDAAVIWSAFRFHEIPLPTQPTPAKTKPRAPRTAR
jgi:hypothetical protein